jgi:hypothetical protein
MMRFNQICVLLVLAVASANQVNAKAALTDAQVTKLIIADSIASYPGNCPCPYNSASNGSSCGRRSAYSRKGGYGPICYAKDVSPQMLAAWRSSH